MSKVYFAINKNQSGDLCDSVVFSKTKTTVRNELRDQGLIPKLVLTWGDVCQVKAGEYKNQDMVETYREYVLNHADSWETAMNGAN